MVGIGDKEGEMRPLEYIEIFKKVAKGVVRIEPLAIYDP